MGEGSAARGHIAKSADRKAGSPTRRFTAVPTDATSKLAVLQRCGDHPCSGFGCRRGEIGEALPADRSKPETGVATAVGRALQPPGIPLDQNAVGLFETVSQTVASPGVELDSATKDAMEARFKFDFSKVRVHTDTLAATSARALSARAYTVGRHIAFAKGQYAPASVTGARLLAHELAHVVQQGDQATGVPARIAVGDHASPLEREADTAANAAVTGRTPRMAGHRGQMQLQRHKDDQVAYTGGQSGTIIVIKAGKLTMMVSGVSGHPRHDEHEVSVGPVPTGNYVIHPGRKRPTVTTLQSGTCGADPIASGYQEITSIDKSPCSGAHYCNVPCGTPAEPTRTCFTPRDCWGPKRIKIEGHAQVPKPGGGRVRRDGFYLHGGNPRDAVSSGCVKSLDDDVFDKIRELTGVKGAVPFCIGSACPPSVQAAVDQSTREFLAPVIEAIGRAVPILGGFLAGGVGSNAGH
jgi:hypothetical protein